MNEAYRKKRIPLATPTMHEEEMRFVEEAFARNWIAPLGFNCDGLEAEIAAYLQGEKEPPLHTLALSAGTAALHLSAKLAGIGRGDVVLCSDMTFAATVNPMTYEGAVPVFVDSERESWNMDPRALALAFERYPQAKAVVLVHLYGVPAKMEEITEICRRHGATLIEDAAEGLGAAYHGRKLGCFGDLGVLSFNGNKIITTSGGGMLITKDRDLRDRALYFATQARQSAPWYQHTEIGYNYRMSNVCAGIGRGQLLHLEEHRAKKEAIYRRYERGLSGLPLSMNPYLPDTQPNFWLSCLLLDPDAGVSPLAIHEALLAENIETRLIWKPMHMQPVYAACDTVFVEEAPVGEDIFARGLCLPSDIKMTEEEQDAVIAAIRRFF